MPQNLAMILAVEDRARVAEQIHELLGETAVLPNEPVEMDEMAKDQGQDVLSPETEDAEEDVPKTLEQILVKATRGPEYASHAVEREDREGAMGAAGVYSALKRGRMVMGPSREFIRLVRLEEKILSKAVLEMRGAPLNAWNMREAELAASCKREWATLGQAGCLGGCHQEVSRKHSCAAHGWCHWMVQRY